MNHYLRILLWSLMGIPFSFSPLLAQQDTYYKDAVQLAARLSREESVFEFSEHLIYTIEDALVSVANSPLRAAQLVVENYAIHAATLSSTQKLHLLVDRTASWLFHLEDDNPISIYLNRQGIQLRILRQEQAYSLIELYSEQDLNMQFLATELSVLDDVWLVEIPSQHQYVNDIQLHPTSEGYRLVYSHQVHPAYNQHHYWEFLVSPSNEVTFVGEYGADLQQPSKNERS